MIRGAEQDITETPHFLVMFTQFMGHLRVFQFLNKPHKPTVSSDNHISVVRFLVDQGLMHPPDTRYNY